MFSIVDDCFNYFFMLYLLHRIQNKDSWISSSPKAIELIPKLICQCKKLLNCFKSLSKYLELLQAIGMINFQLMVFVSFFFPSLFSFSILLDLIFSFFHCLKSGFYVHAIDFRKKKYYHYEIMNTKPCIFEENKMRRELFRK